MNSQRHVVVVQSNIVAFSKESVSKDGGRQRHSHSHSQSLTLSPPCAVPMMMYGFGDARNPDMQSVEIMEALTISFLTDLCHRCRPAPQAFPTSRGYPYATRGKVKMEDLKFALRKDEKKLARLEELLYLEGIINGAKKILSTDVVDDVARQLEAEEKDKGGEEEVEVEKEQRQETR